MLKKIFIAVALGALLSPVGLAFSRTGGKGLSPRGGTTYCSHKARAAGGTHPSCVVTVRTTVTKYKTVYRPVTSTKTVNHTTTSTKNRTYTTTTTLGGGGTTVVVTKTIGQTLTPSRGRLSRRRSAAPSPWAEAPAPPPRPPPSTRRR